MDNRAMNKSLVSQNGIQPMEYRESSVGSVSQWNDMLHSGQKLESKGEGPNTEYFVTKKISVTENYTWPSNIEEIFNDIDFPNKQDVLLINEMREIDFPDKRDQTETQTRNHIMANNCSEDSVAGTKQNTTDCNPNLSQCPEIDEAPKPRSLPAHQGNDENDKNQLAQESPMSSISKEEAMLHSDQKSESKVEGSNTEHLSKRNNCTPNNNYSEDCVVGPKRNNYMPTNNYSEDCVVGPRQNANDFNISEYPEIDEAPKPIRKFTFLKKGQNKEPSGKMNSDTTNNYSEDSVVGPKGNNYTPTNNYSEDCVVGPKRNKTDNLNLSEYPDSDEAPKPIRKFKFLKKGQNKEPSGKLISDSSNKEATTSTKKVSNSKRKAKDGQKIKKQSSESNKANAKQNEQEPISTSEVLVKNNAYLSKTVEIQVSIDIEPPKKSKVDKMSTTHVPCNQVKHDNQNLFLVYLAMMSVLIGFILMLIEKFKSE